MHSNLPWESCRARRLLTEAAVSVLVPCVDDDGVVPDVDGLEAAAEEGGAAGDCACLAADDGGGGGLDGGGADGAFAAGEAAEEDDVALLAIANTVDAIDGFPSPPPSNDPLETCLAAEAKAPDGFDGTSVLAPLGVGVVSALGSPSPSINSGLHLSWKIMR